MTYIYIYIYTDTDPITLPCSLARAGNNICGMVIGYQYSTPDAFYSYHSNRHYTVDNCFVDGIILSYNYPRQHIWTFTAQPDQVEDLRTMQMAVLASQITTDIWVPFPGL